MMVTRREWLASDLRLCQNCAAKMKYCCPYISNLVVVVVVGFVKSFQPSTEVLIVDCAPSSLNCRLEIFNMAPQCGLACASIKQP